MLWQSLLVACRPSNATIGATVAHLLEITPEELAVVTDIAAEPIPPAARAVCVAQPAAGNFPLLLEVYLRDAALERRDPLAFVAGFAAATGCACLTDDGSENPYAMLLIRGPGQRRRVFLDPARLDAEDAYVLAAPVAAPAG